MRQPQCTHYMGQCDRLVCERERSKRPRYCADCGNPDCPTVSPDPFWRRCPASERLASGRP